MMNAAIKSITMAKSRMFLRAARSRKVAPEKFRKGWERPCRIHEHVSQPDKSDVNTPEPIPRRRTRTWKLAVFGIPGAMVLGLVILAMMGTFDSHHHHGSNSPLPANALANLTRQWNSGQLNSRKSAITYLSKLTRDDPSYAAMEPIITAAAVDLDEQVRALALKILADHHSPKLAALAHAQLGDIDPAVRLLGLRALSQIQSPRSAGLAFQVLDDANPAVRAAALQIIAAANRTEIDATLRKDFPVNWQPTFLEMRTLEQQASNAKRWSEAQRISQGPAVSPSSLQARLLLPEADAHNLAGERVSISKSQGKPLVINFWDFAETNSVAMLDTLSALQMQLAGQVQVFAIFTDQQDHALTNKCDHSAVDETGNHLCKSRTPTFDFAKAAARIQAEVQRRQLALQMFVDVSGRASQRFATDRLPACTLVDPQGNITRRFVGARSIESLRVMLAESIPYSPATAAKP